MLKLLLLSVNLVDCLISEEEYFLEERNELLLLLSIKLLKDEAECSASLK